MSYRKISEKVYSVGALDFDRRLFDSLIPLPDGTSYNSYIVKGKDKTVLLDTVNPNMVHNLLRHLNELDINKIDYVVAHHGEQDHSGSIPEILKRYPDAKVLCSQKCKQILKDLLWVDDDKIQVVNDGEKLDIGEDVMEFIYTPWVHWPETMVTYLHREKFLFSCDFFGSHIATTDLYVKDESRVYEAAKRYFAEIMMPFRTNIQSNLNKLKNYEISLIAPSHGPVYNAPEFIIAAYKKWVFDDPCNKVIIPFVSMHGSTLKMVDRLVDALIDNDVQAERFELTGSDIGKLAMSLVDAATVVIGVPTVLAGPHPLAIYAVFLTNALRPNIRFVSVIGSYAWGGKAIETLVNMLSNLKVEIIEPVYCKGLPKESDLKAINNLAEKIAHKHRENNFK